MATLDEIVREHGANIDRVYGERTAGDNYGVGTIAAFLIALQDNGYSVIRED